MITIADVPLALPTREILTDIERDLSLDKMLLMFSRAWPGPGTVFLAMPTHYRRWPPWDKPGSILNRFYWPTGASRWGVGAFLATRDMCEAMHEACFGADGTESLPVNLTMNYELATGEIVDTLSIDNMTVLPPIPIYRVVENDGSTKWGLYMVVVVDMRYYWWNIPCPDLGITETSGTTWQDVIDLFNIVLLPGDPIIVSDIPDQYLHPHRALNLTNEPFPLVMDAVAYNLGARVVVDYAGQVYIQRFQDALDAFNQDIEDFPDRQFLGGDSRYLDLF